MNLDIKHLQEIIVDALDDIKARDIAVFDTTKGSAEFDRVIIATADVARQTKAMALNVIDKVKAAGGRIVSMEGGGSGEWVLVDCSDAVVHIMQPAARLHYNLEELWGQKKIKVLTAAEKAAEAAKKAIEKAKSTATAAKVAKKLPVAKAVPVKAVAKKAAAKKAVTKAVAPKKAAPKKAVAKKAVAKKSVTKKAVAKKAVMKKAVTKKAAPKKASAKKAAPKKSSANSTAKKSGTKKAPAKKAAAKKSAAKPAAKSVKRAVKKVSKQSTVKKLAKR